MTKNRWLFITLLVLAVSAGKMFSALHARRAFELELAGWTQRRVEIAARIHATKTALDTARHAESELPSNREEHAPADTEPVRGGPEPDDALILVSHPELIAKFERATRMHLQQKYAPLFQRLGLSREQTEQLQQLMLHDVENQTDLHGAAKVQGLKTEDHAPTLLRQQQLAELHEAEQNLLGKESFQALEAFERGDDLRDGTEAVASLALFSSTPMTHEQTEQLVAVLVQASHNQSASGKPAWDDVNWGKALDGASRFLSDSQLTTLQAYSDVQRLAQQLPKFFSSQPPPNNPR